MAELEATQPDRPTLAEIITSGRDDTDDFPVTCENGCPEGYLGYHKFSCHWAGHWYLDGHEVIVLGQGPGGMVCVQGLDGGGRHQHVESGKLCRVRYGEVRVKLTRTDGNTMSLMSKVAAALRKAGHGDRERDLTADIFAAQSYDDALQRLQHWVECY